MEEVKASIIDVKEMALKCTTKKEVYRVLTTTGGIYLPPVDQTNSDFIRDILCGDILIIEVPHIGGLRIPDLMNFASKHCEISKYMPDSQCEKYPSRKCICNVVNSLIPQKLQKFVDDKIEESNENMNLKKGNKFSVLPLMTKIFTETKFLSNRRGRFHQLIKSSKHKREDKQKKAEQVIKNQEMEE